MIYAYLRVSSAEQDEQNQKQGVDYKASTQELHIDRYIIDKVSGVKEPDVRNLGKLLRRLKDGDVLIVSELSRISRRIFMLFRILEVIIKKGVKLYSVKENFTLDSSLQSKAMIFAFGLAAEIEREMISARTKEALAYRKSLGKSLGRPIGSKTKNHKLDKHKDRIVRWLNKHYSYYKMGKKLKVCAITVKRYVISRGLDQIKVENIEEFI